MTTTRQLADAIGAARRRMLAQVAGLTPEQGSFKPDADSWSLTEVIEHLVWAEHSGLNKIATATDAWRRGQPLWTDPHPDRALPIDAIIARTWREKEIAPTEAEPHIGGTLGYWVAFFRSCQGVVEAVAGDLSPEELEEVIYPHFLSGLLTMRQRLEFIRYHIEHHLPQVERIKGDMGFPEID